MLLIFLTKLLFYLFIIFGVIYLWFLYRNQYWKRRKVYCPPWTFPAGHFGDGVKKRSLGFKFMDIYNKYKHEPFVGVYIWFARAMVINDLDLVKNVMLKDFQYFQGHGFHTNKEVDPMSQHLFNLSGAEWKRIRTKLTPTFTSTKMKYMFNTLKDCTDEMVQYIDDSIKYDNVLDMKDVIARLGTDVISSCAFGIQTHSFKNPDAEFRKMGKAIFYKSPLKSLIEVIAIFSPETMELLKLKRISENLTDFFYNVVKDTVEYREKNNVERNDFLQLLINMKKAEEKTGSSLTLMEIAAQVFVFFAAGFETSSTAATYALFELAKNPSIRDKLVKEIDENMEKCDGNITYELIHDFQSLNNVVDEILRIYPPVPLLFRRCTTDYQIPESSVVIEKGTVVILPILGIQRDPNIYPNPTQFDPSRFSPENVKDRHQFAHIPFGEGPRICIGNRFGLMQVKLALLMILRNFHVESSEKTQDPLKINPKTFILETEGGIFMKLTRRSDKFSTYK